MERKQFTTTIDISVQTDFKKFCNNNNLKMNDVLEAFMSSYVNGEFSIKREFKFNLK